MEIRAPLSVGLQTDPAQVMRFRSLSLALEL
jgi:hypothetical protein